MGLSPFVLALSLSVLASAIALDSEESYAPSALDQLYDDVVVGDYPSAVARTRYFENENKGEIIEEVVTRLLRDAKRNIVEYAYQLWKENLKETVKQRFPVQFRLILDGNYVKFINKRDGLALKLAYAVDDVGDRLAYGDVQDKTSERISWTVIPEWENNRVHFKMLYTQRNQYLKLAIAKDSIGDHEAYGANEDDTYRHQWYFHPVKYEHDVLFYIFNREFGQALKLGRDVDSDGDRVLWGHNGNVLGSPELFGWFIAPF